jgi:exodeoxyribonuclease (lambda-induced)
MADGNTLQNTSEWYASRLFRFTSSELGKLMTEPRSKADKEAGKLSATAEEYIFDKLAEYLTDGTCLDYKQLNSREIAWGNEHEQHARASYEKRTGQSVELSGFIGYGEYFGGSPDGLVGDDGLIEIKCPYNSSVHARYLLMRTPEDLRKLRPEYYAQMQGNMLVTGRKWADFVSYDPRVQNPSLALKVLRIPLDTEFVERAVVALSRANELKNEYVRQLAENLC